MFLFKKKEQKNNNSSDANLKKSIANVFGFKPENISLYELAFLHKSAKAEKNGHEVSNERLEFLGDAVIDTIVAEYLFKKFPFSDEGNLTKMRSKLVSRSSLNKLSEQIGLDEFIHISKYQLNSNKSYKGNAFESFFGAVFLDKGYDFSYKLLINNIFSHHADVESILNTETNFKSKLLEWGQKYRKNVEYKMVKTIGVGRGRQYVVEVFVGEESCGYGIDYCIKGAEQIASEKAIEKLQIQ